MSAIVSTYNSAKFIRGCLENLVNQTLYQKGELEIVVIDSASPQNEESIVKEFQAQYPNIIYERTSQRETLYASWNRAIKMARGIYITNANTDDILRPDALEIMANYLDNHLEVSLIYPDQLITNTPNDTWATTKANRRWNWPSFNYNELESRCIIGSQPMWRKSLHEKYGYFRPEFTSAGDYEFWLRIGKTENFARIPEPLGLYYENPQGLEHSSSVGQQETQKILEEYGITQRGVIPKTSIPVAISPSELNALPYRQIGQSTVNIGRPLVSVIIPTKDRPEMLTQAIQSVLNQTFTELEIIVVNDGGVDVQSVISRLNAKGNIVYKKHDRTLERSAARNTGIRAARGKYIAYLDDDDNYYPNHIETLVKFLENGEYKIAYTDAVMAQQEKQNGEYVTLHRSVPYSLDFDKDKILVSNCTPNLCLMHEKSCLDEVGLFDETLSTHEDWDLIIRLSRKFDIAHIKETTCEFTQRNDGTNTSSHNRGDFTRTREIIFNQYRHYAEANPAILEAQKEAFIAEAKELAQQVQQIQAQFTQSLDKLQSQLEEKESHLQQNQAEKSELSAQVEIWQRSTQEVKAKLEATQSEKEGVKSQLNSWKQTAEEMQIELDRSRSKLKQAQSQLDRSAFPIGKS
ncbi:glycosyltransferase [Microcoleus vaginatus]|uniref:glycosyltransferase n=1 Tax=Microcoleus vaginatus TaxID=119532 RepID=UPI00403F9584